MSQDGVTPLPRRIPLLPILSVQFVGTLGFSIVLPFLVFLVTRWGGNALIYGIVGATYSVFQLIGAPVLGRWSDHYGRRRILLLSQIGTLVSWIILFSSLFLPETVLWRSSGGWMGSFTLTLPLVVLFFARVCDGLTGGNLSVANAYLADITPEDQRDKSFGRMAVAANLGFILGPMIAGLLGGTEYGEIPPVLAALVISVVATLMIVFALPESNPCIAERREPGIEHVFGQEQRRCFEHDEAHESSRILSLPGIPRLLTLYFLVMLAFNFYYVGFPMHAVRRLNWEVTDTGAYFAAMSFMMVLVQGPLLSFASKRLPSRTLVIIGSVVLATSFLFFLSEKTLLIYVGAGLLAVGNGLMWPSLMAVLSRVAGDTHQGAVQGFAQSVGAVASILGFVIGGVMYDALAENVFTSSAVIIYVVTLVAFTLPRPTPRPQLDHPA
jgi:MFS family permease